MEQLTDKDDACAFLRLKHGVIYIDVKSLMLDIHA
jgi:hypothetical protein